MRAAVAAPLALAVLMLASCSSTRIGVFTFASTKELGRSYPTVQQHVVGEDCSNVIFFLPLASFSPSPQTAVDRAMAQAPSADMLTNITIRSEVLVTLLFNRGCIRVEGDAVSTHAPP
jgi:hypothetical protein